MYDYSIPLGACLTVSYDNSICPLCLETVMYNIKNDGKPIDIAGTSEKINVFTRL